MHHFRSLLLIKTGVHCEDELLASSVRIYSESQLLQVMEMIVRCEQTLKSAPSERIALEMLLLKIIQIKQLVSNEELLKKLESERVAGSIPQPRVSTSKERPKPPSLPKQRVADTPKLPPGPKKPKVEQTSLSLDRAEQSRVDTLMRFAAKELNGSLRKG